MGANWIYVKERGKSVGEAYKIACERADDEYGHQEGYSGQINSTSGCRDVTEKWKASGKTLDEYIRERHDEMSKHHGAECICISAPKANTNKIKSVVEHVVEKGTKKWVLKYFALSSGESIIGSFSTKGEAVKAARNYTEKMKCPSSVIMKKVLEKGSNVTARISYKKSTTEKDGEYLFYGWAND
jgi:hypothetical protein